MCHFHSDLPLACDKIEIKETLLSCYQLQIADFYNISVGNIKKKKNGAWLHYENLKLHMRLQLNLKQIYHVLQFSQLQWISCM